MGWLDKLLGREVPAESSASEGSAEISVRPFAGLEGIRFGRYSDNNKPHSKIRSWYLAEDRFKAKAYAESFAAFFDHISDDAEQNVMFNTEGEGFVFEFIQGSKKIQGRSDGRHIVAKASLAIMEKPSNAVMHRLLNLNFSLRYTRFALDDEQALCQMFDVPVEKASPGKLYNAMRELAKYSDRHDDLLLADFSTLKGVDTTLVQTLPEGELQVKYTYFRKWIDDTLTLVGGLNADSFAGAIAYAFLTLLYRIDFLITPEGVLMTKLEAVSNMYWHRKEEVPLVERNAMMKEGIRKLLDISLEEFAKGVYRTKGTFAVVGTPPGDKVRENIRSANKDAEWYVENKYPGLALIINEYGMAYNQFSYSMPGIITELTVIYMAVMHANFFRDLGMEQLFCNPNTKLPDEGLIRPAIDAALARWPDKYIHLKWDHGKVNYSTTWDFAQTFTDQVAGLNVEIGK